MSCTVGTSTSQPGSQEPSSSLFAPVWEALHLWQTGATPYAQPQCIDALQSESSGLSQAEADEAAAKKLWRA